MTGNIVYPLPRRLPLTHSFSLSRCFKVRRASEIAMKFMRLPTGNNNKLTTCGWISEILYFPLPLEHFSTFHTTPPSFWPQAALCSSLLAIFNCWFSNQCALCYSYAKLIENICPGHESASESEWEWKFESDGGWRNGECECDAIFISLCLFVFVSSSLCLCVRQTEGKDTRKSQRECVGESANTKLMEREREGEKESEKICQFAPTAMLNL